MTQDAINALPILKNGMAQTPDSELVASTLGRLEMILQRSDRVLEPLFRATELNPWEASHHANLSEAMRQQNLHEDAQVYTRNSESLKLTQTDVQQITPTVQAA